MYKIIPYFARQPVGSPAGYFAATRLCTGIAQRPGQYPVPRKSERPYGYFRLLAPKDRQRAGNFGFSARRAGEWDPMEKPGTVALTKTNTASGLIPPPTRFSGFYTYVFSVDGVRNQCPTIPIRSERRQNLRCLGGWRSTRPTTFRAGSVSFPGTAHPLKMNRRLAVYRLRAIGLRATPFYLPARGWR